MGILSWIVFGLIAGIIAKLIMPGKDPGGWIITILLGVGGSYLGGFSRRQAGHRPTGPGLQPQEPRHRRGRRAGAAVSLPDDQAGLSGSTRGAARHRAAPSRQRPLASIQNTSPAPATS
jgi:uncharacterized membrane protein YeaQ/YmgE (transglycosylase-associated protein family)